MTRKRFTKLAMSHGYSKRDAVRTATRVECPYEEFYRLWMALKALVGACHRVVTALAAAMSDLLKKKGYTDIGEIPPK